MCAVESRECRLQRGDVLLAEGRECGERVADAKEGRTVAIKLEMRSALCDELDAVVS